jgi:O-antigen ligase
MSNTVVSKQIRFLSLTLSLLVLLLLTIFNISLISFLYYLLLLIIFNLFLYNFKIGFLIILFLRPVLDLSVNTIIFNYNYLSLNVLSLVGLMILFFSLIVYIYTKNYKKTSIHTAWIIFLLIALLSIFQSFNITETIRELLRLISIFASFYLAYKLFFAPKDLTRLIKVIIFSALIPTLLAVWQIINQSGLAEDGLNRVFGTFTHPNMYAFFLLLPISLVIFLMLNLKPSKTEVYIYSFLFTFFSTALFFTYTRGAYLALIVIIVILGTFKFKKFLIVSLILITLALTSLPSVQSRFYSIFQDNTHSSIGWRLNLWNDGLSYFNNKAWQGYGLGTAELVIASQRDFRLGSAEPHNDYLRLALDGGYPLLLSYLALIVASIYTLIKFYKIESRARLKNFFLFYSVLIIAIFTMSFADNVLNGTALQWQLWALIGASIACTKFTKLKKVK